jgi:hypothetical protein
MPSSCKDGARVLELFFYDEFAGRRPVWRRAYVEIHGSVPQSRFRCGKRSFDDPQSNAWVALLEKRQRGGQQREVSDDREANHDVALVPTEKLFHLLPRSPRLASDDSRPAYEQLPNGCGRHASSASFEQGGPAGRLQRAGTRGIRQVPR